jgi:hypothetical protein
MAGNTQPIRFINQQLNAISIMGIVACAAIARGERRMHILVPGGQLLMALETVAANIVTTQKLPVSGTVGIMAGRTIGNGKRSVHNFLVGNIYF